MSASQGTKKVYPSMVDHKTPTTGVYKRGNRYRVLTRPDGKRKVMRVFDTYEEAVAFKATQPGNQNRGGTTQWVPERMRLHLRGDPCAYCGGPGEVIDHIVPRALGLDHHWSNLTAACTRCNGLKSDKSLLHFLLERQKPKRHRKPPRGRSKMKVWMIWVQGDDATWLEAAWDDETTAANPQGWQGEVDRVRKLAFENNYEMRVQSVKVPGVFGLFEIPTAVASEPSA